ncbi:MAG: YbaN family protein [Bacteroidota bacterium]|nr:YbaN family protein [Bacteroidota bacterium]
MTNTNIYHGIARLGLVIAGNIFVGLGVLGIFLPLLPATPFFLLAAACFAKSSPRFYEWLMDNRWFGSYLKNYRDNKAIPKKVKIVSVSFLWITILSTIFFAVEATLIKYILIIIAIGITIHISRIGTKH